MALYRIIKIVTSYNQGSIIQYVLGQIVKLGTLVNQYSWRISTKQLKLKHWCIASTIVSKKVGGGAEAPLAPPLSRPLLSTVRLACPTVTYACD